MKQKLMIMFMAWAMVAGIASAQSVVYTIRNVVDPPDLKNALNSDFAEVKAALALKGTNVTITKQTGAVTATAAVTPQAPSAVTPTITVMAQRPGAQTPTITVMPLAPATVTPTITVTKEVGAVTASGANSLVTFTNYFNPVTETVSMTDTNGVTALMVTNITWSTAVYTMATNGVVAVTVTGGGAVMTNATAESSALPDFITNATAVSSALLDYPTNATAACSALPLFATNAMAAVTVVGGDAVMTNAIIAIQK